MPAESKPTAEGDSRPTGGRGIESPTGNERLKQALRFALWTIINGALAMMVLYLAGLLARSHTTEGFFRGVADDWETVVPMLLVFGVGLTLWNRWLRHRWREKQKSRERDSDRSDVPID
jgi:cytochrome c oxidase assembly factor CtaG